MLSVSENFHLAAKATTRQVKAKIDIIWTAPSEDTSITVTTNGTNRAANLPQVYDGVSDIPKPWAHLDGTIKADGNHRLMPNPASVESQEQVGWYGSVRSNASAEWATNPELTMEFDARPVISLYVAGDTYYNEYPVDFTLELYAEASLEYTETVTGNTLLKWSKNVSDQSLASITKIILTISKWSAAARIVKISEVYTSFYQTFSGDEIVSMNLLEERVIGDGSLPIGNISSNECDITLNNVKINVSGTDIIDPFFPSNTNSLYYELIKKNRRVEPYLGYLLDDGSIEYIKLGVFWTGDWSVNEQDYTASVSCRDRMELLRKAEYTRSPLFESSNLYDIAQSVLEHAKANIPMASLTWQIDTELQNYTMDYAWFPKQTYFKTIKQIAEACMGQAYMSKNDVLIIEGPGALSSASVAQLTITSPSGSTWVQSPTYCGKGDGSRVYIDTGILAENALYYKVKFKYKNYVSGSYQGLCGAGESSPESNSVLFNSSNKLSCSLGATNITSTMTFADNTVYSIEVAISGANYDVKIYNSAND